MDYLDDIDHSIERMETHLHHMKSAVKNNWNTVYNFSLNNLRSTIKSTRFCVKCAKDKADKMGIPYHKFRCSGGCIRRSTVIKVN